MNIIINLLLFFAISLNNIYSYDDKLNKKIFPLTIEAELKNGTKLTFIGNNHEIQYENIATEIKKKIEDHDVLLKEGDKMVFSIGDQENYLIPKKHRNNNNFKCWFSKLKKENQNYITTVINHYFKNILNIVSPPKPYEMWILSIYTLIENQEYFF